MAICWERAVPWLLTCFGFSLVLYLFIFFLVAALFSLNENETETKRKRSMNGFFETRFDFFSKRFNVEPMKWQKRFPIKRVFLSENVF